MKKETENTGMTEFEKTFATYDILTLIGKGRDESGQAVQRYIVYTPFGSDFYITTRIPREGLGTYQNTLDAMVKVAHDIKVKFQKMVCFEPRYSVDLAGQVVMIGKEPVPFIASCQPLDIEAACEGLRQAAAL